MLITNSVLLPSHARGRLSFSGSGRQPGSADADEWAKYNRLLNLLDNAESHLNALNKLRSIREALQNFQQKSAAWVNFPEPPPYSVNFEDDQLKQVRLKDRELESARLEQAMRYSSLESQR